LFNRVLEAPLTLLTWVLAYTHFMLHRESGDACSKRERENHPFVRF
jgi:hypothetical protein